MRTKNAKRLWPVPVTLGVMALAALLAFGLLATTGAQPVAAQDDPCITYNPSTNNAQTCSVTGTEATVEFEGTGALDGADTTYYVYYPVGSGEDITLYPPATLYGAYDHDDDTTTDEITGYNDGSVTAVSALKLGYKLIELEVAKQGAGGPEAQSDTVMVSGSPGDARIVYVYRGAAPTIDPTTGAPPGSNARTLPTATLALTITFLGPAVLTVPDGDDEGEDPDERSSLKAYTTALPTSGRTAGNPSADRTAAETITNADTPAPIHVTATVRDVKNNVLGDDDATGDARVTFTLMYAAGSDLRSNPLTPDTKDVDEFGQAELAVNNWNPGSKPVQLTVGAMYHGANGQMLDLGEVTISRTGDAATVEAGIYSFDDCVNIGGMDDSAAANDKIDMKMDDCAMASRFGEGNKFIVSATVKDALGSTISTAVTRVTGPEADDVVSKASHGTSNGPDGLPQGAMPFDVYTIGDDPMLGDHMLTVKLAPASDDVDDVMLTFTVAGPPTDYEFVEPMMYIPLALGSSQQFTLKATDTNMGVPDFANAKDVEIVVLGVEGSYVTGRDGNNAEFNPETGEATFTIFTPVGATQGQTVLIQARVDDQVVASHTVMFGMAPTLPTAPGMPMNVMAEATSHDMITVSWDAVMDATSYMVERGYMDADNMTMWMTVAEMTTDMMYMDSGLMAETTYYYRVAAMNAEGTGAYSDVMAMAMTMEMPMEMMAPGMPTMVEAMATSDTEIKVTWEAPASDGGSDITGYMVQRAYRMSDGMMSDWMDVDPAHMGMDMMYMDSGLMAETTYYYRVAAMNAEGTGAYSDVMAMAMTMEMPMMDELGTAMDVIFGVNRGGSLQVSWTKAANASGYIIIGINVNDVNGDVVSVPLNDGDLETWNIGGLTRGATYDIYVAATASGGRNTLSEAVRVTAQ